MENEKALRRMRSEKIRKSKENKLNFRFFGEILTQKVRDFKLNFCDINLWLEDVSLSENVSDLIKNNFIPKNQTHDQTNEQLDRCKKCIEHHKRDEHDKRDKEDLLDEPDKQNKHNEDDDNLGKSEKCHRDDDCTQRDECAEFDKRKECDVLLNKVEVGTPESQQMNDQKFQKRDECDVLLKNDDVCVTSKKHVTKDLGRLLSDVTIEERRECDNRDVIQENNVTHPTKNHTSIVQPKKASRLPGHPNQVEEFHQSKILFIIVAIFLLCRYALKYLLKVKNQH